MRTTAIVLLSTACGVACAAGIASGPVDLNAPGTLERLQARDPGRYEAVAQVLRTYGRVPCTAREINYLRSRYDVREAACQMELLTSYPPKRHVTFVVKDTAYVADVVVKDTGGKLVPAVQ